MVTCKFKKQERKEGFKMYNELPVTSGGVGLMGLGFAFWDVMGVVLILAGIVVLYGFGKLVLGERASS